ncbi:hypothetical protein C8K44_110202 [Aminobacter sp. AP02]|nr:hypothetical protein C8K44_110202 [Aminobacter sp. AP02]
MPSANFHRAQKKGPEANHRPFFPDPLGVQSSSDDEFDELFELEFDEEFELELDDELELELLDELDELLELELFDEFEERLELELSEELDERLLLEFDQPLRPLEFFPPETTDLKKLEISLSAIADVWLAGAATSNAPITANIFFIFHLLFGNLGDCL